MLNESAVSPKFSLEKNRNEPLYPWYDAKWLTAYVSFKNILTLNKPNQLQSFEDACEPLRTKPSFTVKKIKKVFDDERFQKIRSLIKSLKIEDMEFHELLGLGRWLVHDHPYFESLQKEMTTLVSSAVGEEVEPCYNILSLYNETGACPVHMDSPYAKWTLDICIDQSSDWPIYFSEVEPWPEEVSLLDDPNWEQKIMQHRSFQEYVLRPNEAIIFSGSSQWHYRKAMLDTTAGRFCHLLFFHYIPKGCSQISKPSNWEEDFL